MVKADLRISWSLATIACIFAASVPMAALAQGGGEERSWIPIHSAQERYVRALQSLGRAPQWTWSLRPFGDTERLRLLRDDTMRVLESDSAARRTHHGLRILPLEVHSWYNTTRPYGSNDGAVWIGRGATASVQGGSRVRWGILSAQIAPTAFWTQNAAFPLTPSLVAGAQEFADPDFPLNVDRPQRFGNGDYGRIDPGESFVSLEIRNFEVGFTTGHEWWGPLTEFPFTFGNNAPGFSHVFLGTGRPLDLGLVRIGGRLIYGQLLESAFSPDTSGSGRRFVSGIVFTVEPRIFPGLEVGGSRMFHAAWPDSGLSTQYFTHLFEAVLKNGVGRVFAPDPLAPTTSTDNQLASAFARWTFPRSGFELYGEYGREDHNADTRDLLVEPDHAASIAFGVGKSWLKQGTVTTARIESINFQASTLHRHRRQGGTYIHSNSVQGHTQHGQLLGAAVGIGSGAATMASVERFASGGTTRLGWLRQVMHDQPARATGTATTHSLSYERSWLYRGGQSELRVGSDVTVALDERDAPGWLNVRLMLGWTWYPGSALSR